MKELYQTADWKAEKHVPVIEVSKKGDMYQINVSVGKEIAHPNTTAHHISSVDVYFHPENGKFPYLIGHFDFSAHGASTEGADTSTVYTHPDVTCLLKTEKSGKVYASSYCNIHGLWSNEADLK
jgi:superoxide reductase